MTDKSIDISDPDKKRHYASVAEDYDELYKHLKPQNAIRVKTICDILKPHLEKKPEIVVDLGGGTGMLTGAFCDILLCHTHLSAIFKL